MQIDPSRGWGHLVALLVAGVIAVLAISGHRWWQESRMEIDNPSPPPLTDGVSRDDSGSDQGFDSEEGGWESDAQSGRAYGEDSDGSRIVTYAADRAELADQLIADGVEHSEAVFEIVQAFGVSESTAARDLRAARKRAQGG